MARNLATAKLSASRRETGETIDLRVWAMTATGGDYVPSRKGVALDAGKLDDIIGGLELARKHV